MKQGSVAKARGLDEPQMIKAISSPLRLEMLRRLEGRVASPNELRKELGKSIGLISHHIRVLLECDCIELVYEKKKRGSTEHFYRSKVRSNICDAVSELLPQPVREGITGAMLDAILERISRSISAGTIDARTDRHISWMQLKLDQEGWAELMALKLELLDREMELKARVAQRLAQAPDSEEITVLTCNLGIELPSASARVETS